MYNLSSSVSTGRPLVNPLVRPWRRVSKREPCPVPGCHDHDSRCLIFDNGDVLCCHVPSDEPEDGWTGGMYWHRAGDRSDSHRPAPRTPAPSTPQVESADADLKHAVYTRTLALCPLSDADRAYLRDEAGHTEEMLSGNYGTLPRQDGQVAIMARLIQEFGAHALRTIPGVVDAGQGHLRWNGAGLLIAVRDRQGRIQAFQYRVTLANGDKAYWWLSSTKAGGPSSGAPAHIARPPRRRDHRIYVGEGPKTANYVAHTLGAIVIATAGQSNHGSALEATQALAAEEGAEVAVILLDAVDPSDEDAERKERETERNRQKLAAALSLQGYAVRISRWDHSVGKGPDDCLMNGNRWALEIYRPTVDPEAPADEALPSDAPGLTLADALAMPHAKLARLCVDLNRRVHTSNYYLTWISQIAQHRAVITPEMDPSAKRKRALLTSKDRVSTINDVFEIRAAAGGELPTKPVPIFRQQTATVSCISPGAVTHARQQAAKLNLLRLLPQDDAAAERHCAATKEHDALCLLPPETIWNDQLTPEQMLELDSPRRQAERNRKHCPACEGENLVEERVHRIRCLDCGHLLLNRASSTLINAMEDDDDGGVATCNIPQSGDDDTTDESREHSFRENGTYGVATCNTLPDLDGADDVIDLMTTRQRRATLDRAASRRHHSSREVSPWHPEDDLQPPEANEVPADSPRPETLPLFTAADAPEWDAERASDLIGAMLQRCGEACESMPKPWPELDEEAIEAACAAHDLAALEAAIAAAEAGFRVGLERDMRTI